MASALVHAAVPLLALRALGLPREARRRAALAAAACATWPDLDLVGLAFEIRPEDPLGHRGLTHSLLVTAAVGALAALALFRRLERAALWRAALFCASAGVLHGLLDAATAGDVGVALFAPLTARRFLLPVKLLAVCPGGVDEVFGPIGALALANELFYVVVPLAIAVTAARPDGPRRRMAVTAAAWLLLAALLRTEAPDRFAPTVPPVVRRVGTEAAGRLEDIPASDLPDGRLVTTLAELRARGLFDRSLVPDRVPWSSSFFPYWFGGYAGRWQDGAPRLAWRTLFGFRPPTEAEGRAWLDGAAKGDPVAVRALAGLSPTEKVDLVLGRLDFPATKQGLGRTHDAQPKPRYWAGHCNGAAAAALAAAEPLRAVDVVSAGGARVRFHPGDVKALLAVAYSDPGMTVVGEVCTRSALDAVSACAMNPAVLVLAVANRIGLARRSFLVDALPTIAKQYYAVAEARLRVLGEPRASAGVRVEPELSGRARAFVDVAVDLVLSSTTLPYARLAREGERVGLVPVRKRYAATLALGEDGALVGGAWTGDPVDGPDDVLFVGEEPALVGRGMLESAHRVPWWLVRELARASADEVAPSVLDVRALCAECLR